MRHTIMLYDKVAEIFLSNVLRGGHTTAHQAASHMGQKCVEFHDGGALVKHIQASRALGIGTLHYVLHEKHMGGRVEHRAVIAPNMQREEVDGAGLIHFYLQAQGPTAWLLRMDVPFCTPQMTDEGWSSIGIAREGERILRIMRTFTLTAGTGYKQNTGPA